MSKSTTANDVHVLMYQKDDQNYIFLYRSTPEQRFQAITEIVRMAQNPETNLTMANAWQLIKRVIW